MDLEGKWKAILIGGLIIGLAPFVPFLNLACCLYPILGAVVSVAVFKGTNPPSFTNNDGIVLGAMSGAAGAAIYAVLVVPVTLLFGGVLGALLARATPMLPEVPHPVRPLLEFFFSHLGTVVGIAVFFKLVANLAVSVIFGMLGGILGVALFKSRPADAS